MEKQYIKDERLNLLNSKAIEFSNIIEQNLEIVLNELITNNYKQYRYDESNLIKNENSVYILYKDLNELSDKLLSSSKIRKTTSLKLLVLRMVKFACHLYNIHNSLELIKININKLYKYPAIRKQAYIPEFCLALSSFFKENIDTFFMMANQTGEMQISTKSELHRIILLGNQIIDEFFKNITSEIYSRTLGELPKIPNSDISQFTSEVPGESHEIKNNEIKYPEGHVVYYSNIISFLKLIAINSVEFTII